MNIHKTTHLYTYLFTPQASLDPHPLKSAPELHE